jgi:alkanesulfonate monooxygenase SsuD/methylene tetrahydromethanopterin reductase-like flavin-dependent oxidoreductase (luciferase family)
VTARGVSLISRQRPGPRRAAAMGMEPRPSQGGGLPIWAGGNSDAAFRRVGRLGDGWLASRVADAEDGRRSIDHNPSARGAGGARSRIDRTPEHGGAAPARRREQALLRRARQQELIQAMVAIPHDKTKWDLVDAAGLCAQAPTRRPLSVAK